MQCKKTFIFFLLGTLLYFTLLSIISRVTYVGGGTFSKTVFKIFYMRDNSDIWHLMIKTAAMLLLRLIVTDGDMLYIYDFLSL